MRDTLADLNKRWFPYLQAVRCHRNKSRYWYEVRVTSSGRLVGTVYTLAAADEVMSAKFNRAVREARRGEDER